MSKRLLRRLCVIVALTDIMLVIALGVSLWSPDLLPLPTTIIASCLAVGSVVLGVTNHLYFKE